MLENNIQRIIFMAQIRKGHEVSFKALMDRMQSQLEQAWKTQGILTCTVFIHQSFLFIYTENLTVEEQLCWPVSFEALLEAWPGRAQARLSIPMMDIYHNSRPMDRDSWRKGYVPERRTASLAMLRPDLYSSYIYYHYQLQEESPGSFNKYYMIASHENMIVSYSEFPAVKDEREPVGLFANKRSPENWKDVMVPHFIPWSSQNEPHLYIDMEVLFSY